MVKKPTKIKRKPSRKSSGGSKSLGPFLSKIDYTILLPLVAVLLLTFVVFSPALENEFTNWDDDLYVYENQSIQGLTGDNLKKIVTKHVTGNHHPLTMFSLALNYQFSKLNPKSYYATNIVLHLLNTLLVFWFIFLLTKRKKYIALIVATFFAIHPMHVESVAWISERKDVLYTFFYLISLVVYLKYLEPNSKGKWKLLTLSIFLFLLSLISKPAAVVLPVILIFIDFLMGRKLNRSLILDKTPFFILSIAFGVLTMLSQKDMGALEQISKFDNFERLFYASFGSLTYIYKMFIPVDLSSFHSYPPIKTGAIVKDVAYVAFVIIVLAFSFWKNIRIVIFGFAFYIVNLILVLQFLTVGGAFIAERYTYVPYIGLFLLVGWAFQKLWELKNPKVTALKYIAIFILSGAVGTYSYLAFERTKVWNNSEALWTNVIRNYPKLELGYGMRGNHFREIKQYEKAIADYKV